MTIGTQLMIPSIGGMDVFRTGSMCRHGEMTNMVDLRVGDIAYSVFPVELMNWFRMKFIMRMDLSGTMLSQADVSPENLQKEVLGGYLLHRIVMAPKI